MLLDTLKNRPPNCPPMTSPFDDANLFITGGAGYLGRGLLRYLERNRIGSRVTIYSRDEQKHYALRSRFPHGVRTLLGDVRDTERLTAAMTGHDIVIHMAACKHIPEAERDVSEAIGINIEGSQSVVRAAMRSGVRQVVGISTDKVCSPRNAYGMTKALMERTFQEAQRMAPHMRFVCVRYGNVISSTGSVVPLFRDQFAKDGQASITSLDMTRFWFGVDDAVRLIERSLEDDRRRGHTYIARCPAMSVEAVAQAVWTYLGNDGNMPPPKIIGIRPAEKLDETLLDDSEAPYIALEDEGRTMILPPVLEQYGASRTGIGYDSGHPRRWMEIQEFIDLIRDAEKV